MSATDLDDLLQRALRLSAEERGRLAARLLDSLDDEPPVVGEAWERAWSDEIARRVTALDAGEVETVPWEDVRAELRAAVGRR